MTILRIRIGEASDSAVAAVIAAGRTAASRNWIPATSGNFSVRIDATHVAITRSGVDKGALMPEDVHIQPLYEPLLPNSSAEAPLHVELYKSDPDVGAIFHVHSHHATVIAQAHADAGAVRLTGWELQKAFSGTLTHQAVIEVPIFANDQDVLALAGRVTERLALPVEPGLSRAPGYLLAGHGLYAWGRNAQDAGRHLEAFEALFHQIISLKAYQP
ncbi:MAG: methylthioribulose-phosphate dehydratase [Hyphomicrobiales bacterium]|nr:methylthioribulose-phosphate dehydratase [Hyphomicrobiales bacterium]